jgi:RES domain-containing protein
VVLPLPPADLNSVPLPIEELARGTRLFRIHPPDKDPIWFGPAPGEPPRYRFDDPEGNYRVCYLGDSRMSAFVETFLRDLPARVVSVGNLKYRAISGLRITRDIRLVSAHGPGLVQLGTTAALAGAMLELPSRDPTESYAHSQAWSRALHGHPEKPDGILYRSSHDDSLFCVALFEDRASGTLITQGTPRLLSGQAGLLARAVKLYKIRLL